MSSPNFRFKQFTVWHDRCAMKVGTDGVLLGAWCPLPSQVCTYVRVLDVGTGSGLIALMIAQRLQQQEQAFNILGIDIDNEAVEQSRINFAQSPWAASLTSQAGRFQDLQSEQAFDLIVSNPPYFQDSLKNPNAQRATARHTDTLSFAELIQHAVRLLKKDGTLALVLPYEAKEEILSLAYTHGLQPTHITHVHSKPGKPAKRLLVALSPLSNNEASHTQYPISDILHIESENSPRSKEYTELTRDFYL